MERTIGVEQARSHLGQLADEVASKDEPVVLTRRGQPIGVLVSLGDYERLIEARRIAARAELAAHLVEIRERVATAGLDVSTVDEAIAAARGL